MIILKKFAFFVIAGALVGAFIGGVWARIAMRMVALMISGQGSFSLEGSVGILILGAILGVPFGLLFGVIYGRLPLKSWLQGLFYGVPWMLLFALVAFTNRDGELSLLPAWQVALLFTPLFLAEGAVLGMVAGKVGRFLETPQPRPVGRRWFALFTK